MGEGERNIQDKELYNEGEKSPREKELLEKQKAFEYGQVVNREQIEKEEEQETKKSKIISWVVAGLAFLLLVGLYFLLLS